MPGFRSAADHEGAGRYRLADRTSVDQAEAGLQAATHEGVRRTAHTQLLARSQLQCALAVRACDRQRFLGVHIFTSFQGAHINFSMRHRHGQIYHQVNLRVGQQLVNA